MSGTLRQAQGDPLRWHVNLFWKNPYQPLKAPRPYRHFLQLINSMQNYKGLIVGTLVGDIFFLDGYLLTQAGWNDFGSVLFVMIPFVVGFTMALVVPQLKVLGASFALSLVISLGIVITVGWEGAICVLMALPLMVAAISIGAALGRVVRSRYSPSLDQSTTIQGLILLVSAAAIMGFGGLEKKYSSAIARETIITRIILPVQPEAAWRLVERMDRRDGEQPFLLRAGLPVPRRCTLDTAALGGRRICYFDNGYIDQKITRWDFPNAMAVTVTGSTLPGPMWLSFVDAGYTFRPVAGGTEVVRTSTIASTLRPRWYWRTLEHIGVEAEHDYVLGNVERWAKAR